MTTVSLDALEPQLAEVIRRVERGETVVVARDGEPIFDIVPRPRRGGVNFAAGEAFLREKGITNPVPYIADDFDAPLPDDFLLKPLP